MKNKLDKIFRVYGFKRIEMDYGFKFYKPQSNNVNREYYLVKEIEDFNKDNVIKFLNEDILDLELNKSLKEEYENDISKNTSIIILVKVDSIQLTEKEKNLIFKIEEDPYLYKKYVIWYTYDEIDQLIRFESKEDLLEELFAQIIENNNNVSKFKIMKDLLFLHDNDKEKFNTNIEIDYFREILGYYLLTKLFIKLPFMSIKNKVKKIDDDMKLDALKKNIFKELEKNPLYKQVFCEEQYEVDITEDDMNAFREKIAKELEGENNEI